MLVVTELGDRDTHDTGGWHPERPQRLDAVHAAVHDVVDEEEIIRVEPREATIDELCRVHSMSYLRALDELCTAGGGALDPDTVVSSGSCRTARFAAGAGLAAIAALEQGQGDAAFVAVRPPGHHARADRGMGFCLINNVAVAAAALAHERERVLIVDWDVHHGNGTQDIFWNDPNVLYISTHQYPLFPGTGAPSETGGAAAPGLTINFPFPEKTCGDAFLRAFDEVICEAAEAFDPTWVLVSAGFDAHRDDPLAGLSLSAGDFALFAHRVAGLAPGPGRLAFFLEGGYDLAALRRSVAATLGAPTDRDVSTEAPTSGGPGMATVQAVKEIRREWTG